MFIGGVLSPAVHNGIASRCHLRATGLTRPRHGVAQHGAGHLLMEKYQRAWSGALHHGKVRGVAAARIGRGRIALRVRMCQHLLQG